MGIIGPGILEKTGGLSLVLPSGGDDSARIQALISSQCDILLGPGTFLLNSATLKLPKSSIGIKISGMGRGVTIIKLSGSAPRAFDFNRTADYDTFENITLTDFTVDDNNVGGNNHVVIGNWIAAAFQQRINLNHIRVERVNTVNVPTDVTGATTPRNVSFGCSQLEENEITQNKLEDIVIKDCEFIGGNYGVQVVATAPGNLSNVFIDQVKFIRIKHSTNVTPTEFFSSANFHIGSAGFGGQCELQDCLGIGSGDVGVEIDGMTDTTISKSTMENSINAEFFSRNFQNPLDLNAQRIVHRDCIARTTLTPDNVKIFSRGYVLGLDSSSAFSHIEIINCKKYLTKSGSPLVAGQAIRSKNTTAQTIFISGLKVFYLGIESNPQAGQTPNPVLIAGGASTRLVTFRDSYFSTFGAKLGTSTNSTSYQFIKIGAASAEPISLDINNITFDHNVTNGAVGIADTTYGIILGQTGGAGSVRGKIANCQYMNIASGNLGATVFVAKTTELTLGDTLVVENCSSARTAKTPAISVDATQVEKVKLISNRTNTFLANIYPARVERAVNTEFEPSATEQVLVVLTVETKAATKTIVKVNVGGVLIAEDDADAALLAVSKFTFSFLVPAGKKWELKVTEGTVEKAFSTYLPV